MIARAALAGLAAAIGTAALAAVPAGAGTAYPPNKSVKVLDDYFTPSKMTVKRRTRVAWKWGADNGNTHDVKLKSGPDGVKRFHSEPATADFTFRRRLRKPGKYVVICTYHRTIMRQTITVR